MSLSRQVVERLIFGDPTGARRFTQDSPVLPDVWIAYGQRPRDRHALLLTPHRATSPGALAVRLRRDLAADRTRREVRRDKRPAVAHVQAYVRAELDLPDLVRVALPLTPWWLDYVRPFEGRRESIAEVISGGRERLVAGLDGIERASRSDPEGLSRDLLWTFRIVGALAWARRRRSVEPATEPPPSAEIVDALAELLDGMVEATAATDRKPLLWLINRDRAVRPALHRSVLAVKADAARRLFKVDCSKLGWAVVDGGVNAAHPAFGKPSRVVDTWDFTRVAYLLDPGRSRKGLPEELVARLDAVPRPTRRQLEKRLLDGGEVDWDLLAPILRVPPDAPDSAPASDHGTHVAGILAGSWIRGEETADGEPTAKDLVGMCPDLKVYDFRVFSPDGPNDEFGVLAALQLIRHLNRHADARVIHGANLSLSILHDVANYACGRTPICEECERLVASGVVVVAAAGNSGYLRYVTEGNVVTEGYHTVSISDPGNAEGVITVGATHRFRPHTYGVSYFSSRGPTGDGRRKPDLVAPGEKILAPVGADGEDRKDGTSMAAPHVSGAAAMLMARHSELEGDPARIKRILCASATDLGREPYFQGHGMLDVLRALQSI